MLNGSNRHNSLMHNWPKNILKLKLTYRYTFDIEVIYIDRNLPNAEDCLASSTTAASTSRGA